MGVFAHPVRSTLILSFFVGGPLRRYRVIEYGAILVQGSRALFGRDPIPFDKSMHRGGQRHLEKRPCRLLSTFLSVACRLVCSWSMREHLPMLDQRLASCICCSCICC